MGRIAALGMKRGSLGTSPSKAGIMAYVKGFAKARQQRAGLRKLAGPAGVKRVKAATAVKPRMVTRKGGLNPRARAPRAKVGGAKNQAYVRGHGYDPRGPGAG